MGRTSVFPVPAADTTWLGDPSSYLGLHRTADFYISTDCLSHQVGVHVLGRVCCVLSSLMI
jgi:hypothetical protein